MATSTEPTQPVQASSSGHDFRYWLGRFGIYAILLLWTFIALFPIYWTVTTSFKTLLDINSRHYIPWPTHLWSPDFIKGTIYHIDWKGWRSLGLSPDTIREDSSAREQFMLRFMNSTVVSLGAASLATLLGSLAAYGLSRFSYKFGPWKNQEISFWFLSQLILPPVALAMPLLVLYKKSFMLYDSRIGLISVYTLMVLPVVIWVMRDQFASIPVELEQAALVDGSTTWGAFMKIVLPIAGPGLVAAFTICVILCWNEYFLSQLLTASSAPTLPVMVASQTGSQGNSWWSMAALSTAAIMPLAIVGIVLERYIVRGLTAGAVK